MRYQMFCFKFSMARLNGLKYDKAAMMYCLHDTQTNTYFNIEHNDWQYTAPGCWYSDLHDLVNAAKENLKTGPLFEFKMSHSNA